MRSSYPPLAWRFPVSIVDRYRVLQRTRRANSVFERRQIVNDIVPLVQAHIAIFLTLQDITCDTRKHGPIVQPVSRAHPSAEVGDRLRCCSRDIGTTHHRPQIMRSLIIRLYWYPGGALGSLWPLSWCGFQDDIYGQRDCFARTR